MECKHYSYHFEGKVGQVPRLVHNFGGVTTCISLVRKGKVLVEFRSFGGVATCISLDRNEKLGLSSGEFLLSPGKVGYLWFASCGSPRVLAPWVCLEAEVEGHESGSCRVCIRNLMTKVARCFLAVFLTIVEVKEEWWDWTV